MMTELKPCPFCGTAGMIENKSGSYGYYPAKLRIRCADQGCSGTTGWFDHGERDYDDTPVAEGKAITAWNTRTPAPASADAMKVWEELKVLPYAVATSRTSPVVTRIDRDQAAASIIEQYGDQCRAEAEAAGYRRGVEAAAAHLDAQPDNGISFQTLWRLAREIRRFTLLETQEKG